MAPRLERGGGGFQLPNSDQENSLFLRALISVVSGDTDTVVPTLHLELSPPPFAATPAAGTPAAAAGCVGVDGCHGSYLAAAEAMAGSSSEREGCSAASFLKDGGVGKITGKRRGGKFGGVRQRPWGRTAAEVGDPHPVMRKWLGTFDAAAEAATACAHDVAATLAFRGHRARLNFLAAAASSSASSSASGSSRAIAQRQHLPEIIQENCRSNASSSAYVPQLPEQGRPVAREHEIWDELQEIMMMDGTNFSVTNLHE
ncbi:hypothetical protein D1007_28145 [Hordeum vulgare]|uniref:ethylene-responsive transcription factor ERF109-like n=1 Tax=Hordeum vulgare subsp. vulgare TaxID=112509 RepID=UPI000B4836F8|nr:ethylene-responsive transcription factor ERF109-like [Hordeum vulgare subsp. vulgare]KAE8796846.1 hypothetical protein D1007_28145 [Hordeum vulgare]